MTRVGPSRTIATLVLFLLPTIAACDVDPFCLDCVERDGGVVDGDARVDAGILMAPDAAIDAFRPPVDAFSLPDGCALGAPELCNNFDDDCDGEIDEGYDLTTDRRNCGECGHVCAPPNAFATCEDGRCVMGDCATGYHDLDHDPSNGCEYRCTVTADHETACDRRDEDCDGLIDEDFDLMTDVNNCGVCGRNCRAIHGVASCAAGVCGLERCEDGYYDLDGLIGNGCEYRCTPADPAVEVCNGRDDDCDGEIDEGDPGGGARCGSDVGACEFGTNHCVAGRITCTGGVSASTELCNGLDDDCDGVVDQGNPEGGRTCGSTVGACIPGRERCVSGRLECQGGVVATPELCNGIDDDCDGVVDQGNPEGGGTCGSSVGTCREGTLQCSGGGLVCAGSVGPTLDVCDGLDNDCDGTPDQTFDLANDPRNCGVCGRTCSYPNAIAGCSAGACTLVVCRPGYVNLDHNDANGCEYACTPSGTEACNGVDDDCDGMIDEGVTPPANFCNPNGVCAGTVARCAGTMGFVCDYPDTYQVTETRCDNLDNDCDGLVDEAFPTKGNACNNGGIGACRRDGTLVCNAAMTGVECNAPTGIAPGTEVCNGLDDDCDGVIDDSPRTNWVAFNLSPGVTRWIFQYEASRPNASASSAGTMTHVACSEPNRIPWSTVTPVQAQAACTALGARLCTEAEWQRACQTAATPACVYAYGASCGTYSAMTCNGRDYSATSDAVIPTGTAVNCYANWGTAATRIFDMTGNLQEWTAQRGSTGVYGIRGGSYNDIQGGLTCTYAFEAAGAGAAMPNTGFRCCRDTAP